MESDSLCDDGDEDCEDCEDYLEEDDSEIIEKVRTPMYRLLHSDARIMFMSATPRLFEESDETADGMDIDSEIFGEVDYSFPMGKAIEEGYICDYMVYVPTMAIKQDTGIDDVIQELNVKEFDKQYNKEILVKARFIVRGCMGTGSRKCIIYCIDQEECRVMMACIRDLCENYMAIDCWCDMITSDDSRDSREKKLQKFAEVKEKAFICSVQILNECVDIPECDSIFITYASKSRIRNIQRLCRANRKDTKNPNKIASVFLWCDEYNELASFMKHIKEYDSRFTYEQVKRVCSSDSSGSSVMKVKDNEQDKKGIDSIIVGYKGVSSWYEMLEKVKKFIDDNGKRPTPKNGKELHNWMSSQLQKSRKRLHIMKIDEIYNTWNEFIKDSKYRNYFTSYVEDWKKKLEDIKLFINNSKSVPKRKINKLGKWLSRQKTNFKNKSGIMKLKEIHSEWKKFINDENYNMYILSGIELWNFNLKNVINYININKKRPSSENSNEKIRYLGEWILTQQKNMKKKTQIMQNKYIYDKWIQFIENENYKKYFEDKTDIWINKLNLLKDYINKYKKLPKRNNFINNQEENIANWLNMQKQYFKKNKLKIERYNIWNACITDPKYSSYFS